MAVTHKLIQTITVGSGGAASIEFGSIPQTYTDLMLLTSLSASVAGINDGGIINFNGLATNLSVRWLRGNGSTASSSTSTLGYFGEINGNNGGSSSIFSNHAIYIPNYAGSANKSFSIDSTQEANQTTAYTHFVSGLWSSTAAITSIKITNGSVANFVQYSSASLYGIKNS